MKKITKEEFVVVINLHNKHLRSEAGGVRLSLEFCDLSYCDLRGSNLRGCDLRDCDLIHMYVGGWGVYVQQEHTRIGCEYHKNSDWVSWTPEDVAHMDEDAEVFWEKYKPMVCAAIHAITGESNV